MIFEAPRFAAFLRSLTDDEALRLILLVYSVYLEPSADGDHIFDYRADGAPDARYAFDGEFRVDFVVLSDDALIIVDATRAQRLGRG